MHVLPWLVWIGSGVAFVTWGVSCDARDSATKPLAKAAAQTFDESLIGVSTPMIAEPGGTGVYVLSGESMWLVRGTKAERVTELNPPSPPASGR